MKRTVRTVLSLFALGWVLMGHALAYEVSLRSEPYTDVLIFRFGDDPLPPHSVRRSGPQQLTVTFHQAPGSRLMIPHSLAGGSLVTGVQPGATGFTIQLKSKAFGYVSAPVPGKAEFEVHVFADAVGGRWTDLSTRQLTLAPPPRKAAAAQPAPRAVAPAPVAQAAQTDRTGQTGQPPSEPEAPRAAAPEVDVAGASPPEAKTPEIKAPEVKAPEIKAEQPPAVSPAPELAPPVAASRPDPASFSAPLPPGLEQPLPVEQSPPPQESLTLREAMDLAQRNNPRISSFENRAAGAAFNVKSARGALLPHAQISAGLTKIKNPDNKSETNSDYIDQTSRSFTLQVSQNVFDGLMRLSNLARTRLAAVRSEQERRRVELDTAEAVQREYFKLMRIRSDKRAYAASVARLGSQKEAAHAFYRLEMAPRLTVLQVETALAQAEQRLSRSRSDEQVQITKLNALLGHSGPPRYDFAGELAQYPYVWHMSFEDCVAQAQARLPELVIAHTDVDIAQEELNIVQGKAYPRVDATASYNKQNTSYGNSTPTADRHYYTMGLTLGWEVFSSGEQYYEAQARKQLLKAAQDDLSGLKLTVFSLVRESYLNVSEARTQIRIAHLRSKEASEAYEQASTRFRSGIGTSLDVLDAQEKVVTAEAALNQAQADFFTSLANLHRVMGRQGMPLGPEQAPEPPSGPVAERVSGPAAGASFGPTRSETGEISITN